MARRNRNSSRKESAPGWVWMLFGLSMGLMVAIVAYLRAPGSLSTSEPATASAAVRPASEPAAQRGTPRATRPSTQPTAPAENRFEFYEILPQFEVVVPEDDAPRAAAAARPRPAETPGSFLLQVGSFSAAADADRLKANLALLGFESHVQRVRIEDDIFNRVRIGPIGTIDAAKRTQRQLRDAGFDTFLMQVPK
jgi:cell division protein FtsN